MIPTISRCLVGDLLLFSNLHHVHLLPHSSPRLLVLPLPSPPLHPREIIHNTPFHPLHHKQPRLERISRCIARSYKTLSAISKLFLVDYLFYKTCVSFKRYMTLTTDNMDDLKKLIADQITEAIEQILPQQITQLNLERE
ncbi:unnamed protein product [Cochlearia groenlandica]